MALGDIVLLCTQTKKTSDGRDSGVWCEELAEPYYVFKEAGYNAIITSINGGEVPIAANSIQGDWYTATAKKFMHDDTAQKELKTSTKLASLDPGKITALFAAGGHGASVDLAESSEVKEFVEKLYNSGKTVSAVCHGPMIFSLTTDSKGEAIVKGKKVTGLCGTEEDTIIRVEGLPAPEERLKSLGAKYSKASSDWGPHVQVDESGTAPVVTGQNPASSEETAKAVVKALKK